MAVDLSDFVESLKREVTPPGSTLFADVSDNTWIGYLADAFWEARLDGFLSAWSTDEDGLVTPVAASGTDLPRAGVALVIIYAGVKVLRNRLMNMNTVFRTKAGPVEYEVQNSATLLAEMLKQLKATKDQLLTQVQYQTDVYIDDIIPERMALALTYRGNYSASLYGTSANASLLPGGS